MLSIVVISGDCVLNLMVMFLMLEYGVNLDIAVKLVILFLPKFKSNPLIASTV